LCGGNKADQSDLCAPKRQTAISGYGKRYSIEQVKSGCGGRRTVLLRKLKRRLARFSLVNFHHPFGLHKVS